MAVATVEMHPVIMIGYRWTGTHVINHGVNHVVNLEKVRDQRVRDLLVQHHEFVVANVAGPADRIKLCDGAEATPPTWWTRHAASLLHTGNLPV